MEFKDYARRDNRLMMLESAIKAHAKSHKTDKDYCANENWYAKNGYKSMLCKLVGWGAKVTELQSEEAYNVCYDYLYSIMPNCNHDGTCRG